MGVGLFYVGGGGHGGWHLIRLFLPSVLALRAARGGGRVEAFKGPWGHRGDSRREAVGIVDT